MDLRKNHFMKLYIIKNGGTPIMGRSWLKKFDKFDFLRCNFLNDDRLSSLFQKYPEVFSNDLGSYRKGAVKLYFNRPMRPVFF